jgi:hypothetical protein
LKNIFSDYLTTEYLIGITYVDFIGAPYWSIAGTKSGRFVKIFSETAHNSLGPLNALPVILPSLSTTIFTITVPEIPDSRAAGG